jgi:hypothetical protein
MEQPLFIELIQRTKSVLYTINKLTQLSQEKFGDKQFREFCYTAINKEIEKHDLLLNTFLKYNESTTPISKKGTVNKVVEVVLKKHQVRSEEKKITIFKIFEEDLPETIVPDEQLKFILDSLLQYTMTLIPSGGNIELLTKSVVLPKETKEDKEFMKRNGKCVQIVVTFTGDRRPMAPSGKGLSLPSLKEEVLSDLIYKLVDMIVKKNQGMINFEVDERESRNSIFLKFPVERRKVVHYGLTNE